MEITLLLGAASFRLTAAEAEWLETTIREAFWDGKRRTFPVDESVWGCILLADVLRED